MNADRTTKLAERAAAEGLVDVAYTTVDSPIGPLFVASTDKGLVRLWFGAPPDSMLEQLALRLSPRVMEAPAKLDPVRRQLDEYFEGRRTQLRAAPRLVALARLRPDGCSRRPTASPTARCRRTAPSPTRRATRPPAGPRAAPSAPTPSPSSSRATASSAPTARSPGYGGGMAAKEFLLRLEGYLPPSSPSCRGNTSESDVLPQPTASRTSSTSPSMPVMNGPNSA